MLKIFLVDDEYLVLKGIESIIMNQADVAVELKTAMDAIDALDKLKTWNPDIIITDINMPEMDGLSMLEQISLSNPNCKFMIISGYEDTEYLKHALRLHVVDYLTKPLDKHYFLNRLKTLDEQKENEILHTLLKIKVSAFTGESNPKYSCSDDEISSIFPEKDLVICTFDLMDITEQSFLERIRDYFPYSQVISQNGRFILFLNYSAAIELNQIRLLLGSLLPPSTPCGVILMTSHSSVLKSLSEVSLYFQMSLCDLILSLLPVSDEMREHILEIIFQRTLRPVIRVLTQGDAVASYLKKTSDFLADNEEQFLLVFTEFLSAYMFTTNKNLPSNMILSLYQSLESKSHDKNTLISFIEKHMTFRNEMSSVSEGHNFSVKISDACEFIEEHYKEDISLSQLAETFCVNYSYLSYIFRKETGVTFLQYLTKIRLREACKLMDENPNLPLDEVAEQTGFHSTSYFHKIFKAYFGISPRQWLLQR